MKKIFFYFILMAALATITLMPALTALATGALTSLEGATPEEIKTQGGSIEGLVANIIKALLAMMGVLLLILIIYGGFIWGTAGGDPNKVSKAKGIIISAIIGLFITMSAYAITLFVIDAIIHGSATNWQ